MTKNRHQEFQIKGSGRFPGSPVTYLSGISGKGSLYLTPPGEAREKGDRQALLGFLFDCEKLLTKNAKFYPIKSKFN